MAATFRLFLAFVPCLLALLTGQAQAAGRVHTLDLARKELSPEAAKNFAALTGRKTINEYSQRHFWFANFTVGAKNVSTLIDTASYDVIVLFKDDYTPSAKSQNLNESFEAGFLTTHSNGKGFVELKGSLYKDIVGVPSMMVPNQELGVVTKVAAGSEKPFEFYDVILGLTANNRTQFPKGSRSWFRSVCDEGLVDQCRYGLAFGTNKRGKQILGGVDKSLFSGDLTVSPVKEYQQWDTYADVVVNGKTISKDQYFISDSGTSTIAGPKKQILAIFKELGVTPIVTKTDIRGTYPCDKYLDFGFRLPSTAILKQGNPKASKHAKEFMVSKAGMAFTNLGNGTCFSALEWISSFGDPATWLVGQAWMQSLYVDHDATHNTLGFAHLKSETQ